MLRNRTQMPDKRELTKPDLLRRRSSGISYTTPEDAKVLARWAIQKPTDLVLEPSFGGCAMLSAAARVFESLGAKDPSRQLYGFDVDSDAFEHLERLGLNNRSGHFRQQDFLRSNASDLRVDAVLANPPFVSYHRQSSSQRVHADKLRKRYLPALPRLASLWVHFVLHAMCYLKQGGRMAFVLPNAVRSADYARPLLEHLQLSFGEVQLIHVSERLFIQAGTDERISLLLLSDYTPEGVERISKVRISDVAGLKELVAQMEAGKPSENDSNSTRATAKQALLDLGERVQELGAIASIRIGEVVGDVKFFVKPLTAWHELGIDHPDLVPLATRALQLPGLETRPAGNSQRVPYLLLPARPHKYHVRKYLTSYPPEASDSNKTFLKRAHWFECSYETDAHAFIGSMNHAYPRVILNSNAISVSNAFYKISLISSPEFERWLALLSLTTPFRVAAEVYGRMRGSGGIKLEPSDVRRLLLPCQLPALCASEFAQLNAKIEGLLLKSELDAANQLLDSEIYIKPKLIDATTMSQLRTHRMRMTQFRLRTTT